MSTDKTLAMRLLEGKKVAYTALRYDPDVYVSAVEVAEAAGLPPEQVFKTLVVMPDDAKRKPMLVVIPGPNTLDLKALAKATNLKKAKMAAHADAEQLTGLQTGGISPLALINKGFDVFLDNTATNFTQIAVSAGERGAQVFVPVSDLIKLTRARVINLNG